MKCSLYIHLRSGNESIQINETLHSLCLIYENIFLLHGSASYIPNTVTQGQEKSSIFAIGFFFF